MTCRESFETEGYCVAPRVYGPQETDELVTAFDRIVTQLEGSGEHTDATWSGPETERLKETGDTVLHTHNVHQYSSTWMRALLQERFLDVAETILGPDIILHHTKLFCKPPGVGSPFPLHQDWSYFPTEKDSMVAAVIHLTDVSSDMGCLRVCPGSHREGRLSASSGQSESTLPGAYSIETAVPVEARAGDVLFFHYLTLHGSLANRSAFPRKTVLVQMYAGDDRVEEGNEHPDEKLALRGWNHHATRERCGQP